VDDDNLDDVRFCNFWGLLFDDLSAVVTMLRREDTSCSTAGETIAASWARPSDGGVMTEI
jgi:hypothetical protein